MSEFSLDLPGIPQYNTGSVILNLMVGAVHSKTSSKRFICLRKMKVLFIEYTIQGTATRDV
jgi:hypothetical protein